MALSGNLKDLNLFNLIQMLSRASRQSRLDILYGLVAAHNQQLEARVAARTAQLERQQEKDIALFCHLSGFNPFLYRRLMQVFPDAAA